MRYSSKPHRFLFLFATAWTCTIIQTNCQASFIETTIGTAVVNDATAAYYNPAALVLLRNPQIIPLGTVARFNTHFTGQSTTVATNLTETGSSSSTSNYYSPSLYIGLPLNKQFVGGLAAVSNFANRNPEENSVLRYVQSANTIQDYDFVPSFAYRISETFSVGAGINFSYINFDLKPIIGFPGSNIADSQSNNKSDGWGIGANAGLLFKPRDGTLIGFNYRSLTTYNQTGTSSLSGTEQISSDHYRFKLRTPARSVLSISQLISQKAGMIATAQRVQWSAIKHINVGGIATLSGTTPVIVNASVPYYLHDSWILTLGGNYRFKPNWILRVAGTYNQSPANGSYQLSTGSSYILGASLGCDINKTLTIDGSYAHAFIQNQRIDINGTRHVIDGTNKASRDAVSLKFIVNI